MHISDSATGFTADPWLQGETEIIDYAISVVAGLASAATAIIFPSGPTIGAPTVTPNKVTARVSDVSAGVLYTLQFHITSDDGQERNYNAFIRGVD